MVLRLCCYVKYKLCVTFIQFPWVHFFLGGGGGGAAGGGRMVGG